MTRGQTVLALATVLAAVSLRVDSAYARLPDDRPPDQPVPTPTPQPTAPAETPPPSPPAAAPQPARPADPAKPESPAPAAAAPPATPAVVWPHPLISEVLYAVPTGPEGDASGDGIRDVSGDEFIELYNPHARPIQLRGYALADTAGRAPRGSSGGGTGPKFVFPAFDLPAGGVVVVFNGRNTTLPGPVGDARQAPTGPNERFGGGLVFNMKQTSQRASLSNTFDSVCLIAPDGTPVHRVRWGKPKDGAAEPAGPAALLEETAPTVSKCGVVRDGAAPGSVWRPHLELGGVAFSPGKVDFSPPAKPAEAPRPGPGKKR